MTTFDQPSIEFPSAPIDGETRALVEAVANDPWADGDWRAFWDACHECAARHGVVDPNVVRGYLTPDDYGSVPPRRLSAFYHRAVSEKGFLDFSHWGINTDTKGRNAGRPARIYKLRNSS